MSGPPTTASAEPTELVATATRAAQHFAVLRLGRPAGADLELIRASSACVYRAGPFVIRVAPPNTPVRVVQAEADVARLLAKSGIATPPVVDPGYLDAGGRVISAWKWVEHTDHRVDPSIVGQLAARINAVAPTGLDPVDPLAEARLRIVSLPSLGVAAPAEQRLLETSLTRAERALADAWAPPTCVVHGDMHVNNVLNATTGPVVVDFECAGAGTPELDLAMLEFKAARYPTEANGACPATLATYQEITGRHTASPDLQLVFAVRDAAWAVAGRALDPVEFATESAGALDYLARAHPSHG